MSYNIRNLVFEGGGIFGIAYLGVLDFLSRQGILQNVGRVAGTSAGAITACIASFNLPFREIKQIADSLDYRKIPEKEDHPDLKGIPVPLKNEIEKIFGDIDGLYRLMKDYGWYSSNYFYTWLREQIARQFDGSKKPAPYTFADFKNPYIHQGKRPFLDLYVIGTDISYKASRVFSYETTPYWEVAEAVRISMSIPLFFEAIKINEGNFNSPNVFVDGGVLRNYPINIFDPPSFPGGKMQTLGARFKSTLKYSDINNFLDFVTNLVYSFLQVQQDMYRNNPYDLARSMEIYTNKISPLNFNISLNDPTYNFLYHQGYQAAQNYFQQRIIY